MPASYAHHRFGQMGFQQLPEEVRRTVQRFRQLYDVGQHGPDLFFYYQPLFHTKMGELGGKFHGMTGRDFFGSAVEKLREAPSEGAEAYLYGVLGHYLLDAACHPFVRQSAEQGIAGHTELETEFDRYLLEKDGKKQPHLQNLGRHMKLTWGESVTVSHFYPPASAYTIRRSVVSMAVVHRMLTMKNRELLTRILHLGGENAAEMVMYNRPNHKCVQLLSPLNERFELALARYPAMAAQLAAHIRKNVPLGEEFDVTFG